ncbi:MAG TPA: hypothetical protein VMR70_17775 [Flavisolibacter sp.]|nr:hypothetical protein [Flavisolibacter sp.]
MGRIAFVFFIACLLVSRKAASQQRLPLQSDSLQRPVSLKILPQNFYNKQLSFFCKKEVQLQKLTTLPVYFRLGSKEYVDYLEQKPNAIFNRQ